MRKKVDERIRTLIENGVKNRHRSMFVIVGDKSRDQIVNLHYMLSKSVVKTRPTVLWCYKDKLEISSHKKKRVKQTKKLIQRGLLDPEKADPFSLFLETGGLTYCMYNDSERILGNTFGMCILQDFEALTPNLLARTIETVEGGGLIILLLRSLSSLTSLYTMVMDVHERFRTESHPNAAGRFNERFLLSMSSCKACVVMDDELNILPISSHMRSITAAPVNEDSEGHSVAEQDLKDLKEQLNDDFPIGPLIKKCCTLDQGKAVMTFLDGILDKTLRSTIALLAARGRGKSASLGLSIAGAIAAGYSNIFVTAPSPENLKTLFEFICKGFEALEYKEHIDYDVVKSANPDFKKATVRVNIYKQHRQTIQYIQPHEHEKLSQVELLVVDEAAAIPLPVVKSLLGPYLVFLASTVNGYEGTGRSLSLKLLQQLEEQSHSNARSVEGAVSGRLFKKVELNESIRYSSGDPIESWLNALLCLDVTNSIPNINRLPPPSECDLYYVNRDTLFSYHKDSEVFLQRMMALYVASHYKNSPNDLQLMADAPAHHLFVLLGPVDESKNHLPDILCVIQVALEGQISRKSAIKGLTQGAQPSGDQIPWKISEQFQDAVFPSLSGVRIVRIATHPSAMRLGYGSVAVELLTRYYEGQLAPISETEEESFVEAPPVRVTEAAEKVKMMKSIQKFGSLYRVHVLQEISLVSLSLPEKHTPAHRIEGYLFYTASAKIFFLGLEIRTGVVLRIRTLSTWTWFGVMSRIWQAVFRLFQVSLAEENIKPRSDLPHLLVHLHERRPEKLHYMGVSFGLTLDLFRFWTKHKFAPFYIGHVPSAVTGEHTCMVLKPLNNDYFEVTGSDAWGFFSPFYKDFLRRFARLLSSTFRSMEYKVHMSILEPKLKFAEDVEPSMSNTNGGLRFFNEITPHDMKRLEAYTNNLSSYHLILDLVPLLAQQYVQGKFNVSLSPAQKAVLFLIGLQNQDPSSIERQMNITWQQVMSLFRKLMTKLYRYLYDTASKEIDSTLPRLREIEMKPHEISLDEDLYNAAKEVEDGMKAKTEGMLDPDLLQQYAIVDGEADLENALQSGGGKVMPGGLISVKTNKAKIEKHGKQKESGMKDKRRGKEDHSSKSNKKRRS